MTPDVTKSPLSGASLVLHLTEVRGFRPTTAVIKAVNFLNLLQEIHGLKISPSVVYLTL